MLIVILFVSFCANFYSIEYMLYDPHKIRFFSYLSLFTFTMIILVTSNNLVQLFFGWESVGISSYLLINFWYTRIQANKSSILAIMANKIGDILLLFSCVFLIILYNSLCFNNIFLCVDNHLTDLYYNHSFLYSENGYFLTSQYNIHYVLYEYFNINLNNFNNIHLISFSSTVISLFIILASVCKSAQAGFHFWLAEAMEGPTPVSSLLHAATMVTAGIFLTVRCSFLFTYSNELPLFIIFIGSITSFFSSLIGLTQYDLKKIVAYSTCSQLGYMFISNGIFSYNFTMFHLFNHAFFKALLFLTSGYIIHLMSNEQDLRKMGGFLKIIPLPYICLVIGSLSLMGIPYLSGFFSKDTIIENFYNILFTEHMNIYYYNIIFFSQILLSISIFFTILYSVKLIYYVFINQYNGYYFYIKHLHFSGYFMIIPLIMLSILSICSGYIFSDIMIGVGSSFWKNSINFSFFYYEKFILNNNFNSFSLLPYEFNKFIYYYVFFNSIYLSCFTFIIYHFYLSTIYYIGLGIHKYYYYLSVNVNRKMLFFNRLIINNILFFLFRESYNNTYKLIDKNILELLGPFGIFYNIKCTLNKVFLFQTGLLFHYLGIILLILIYFVYFLC